MNPARSVRVAAVALALIVLAACDLVPKESVELSNTVGKDLEEVHRAHRALAELHFGSIEREVNSFIDTTYRPAFIREFAKEFSLNAQVTRILNDDPDKLLPVLTRFVEVSVDRIEQKRVELLAPIQAQKVAVITEIDQAHRQIQAAQAVVTGHLSSVRRVREVQNEILADVGLEGIREKVAAKTADVSNRVADLVVRAGKVERGQDAVAEKLQKFDEIIDDVKAKIEAIGN